MSADRAQSAAVPATAHTVRLFEDDDYPAAAIADYVHGGLAGGGGALVLATAPHLTAITAVLDGLGTDAQAAQKAGRLTMRDADEVAASMLLGGEPRRRIFDHVVGKLVRGALPRGGQLRAYGEIVDVLSRGGNRQLALALEGWWNDLLHREPVELICGYGLASFADADSVPLFQLMCAAHAQVKPLQSGNGSDRLLAQLQQSSVALRTEARERRLAELQRDQLRDEGQTARMRALLAADQIGRLQRITAALAEVQTVAEIAGIVCGDLVQISGAIDAVLAVPVDGGEWLQLLGRPSAPAGESAGLRLDSSLPVADAFRDARPRWQSMSVDGPSGPELRTLACMPLLLRGQVLGAIEVVFAGNYEPPASERALLEDQVRQVAIAVDRARSHEAAERAREVAEQERLRAESASRAKDEFLAMLGHELRNPLAPIVTALQLMKLRGDVRSTKEQTIIERQVHHLVRLVDDLLDVSRITRGKVELRRRELDLANVVARAVEMASPLLEQRQHHFEVSVPREDMHLIGDEDRLTQVLANLLSNAAKYTPHRGHIALTAERDGGHLVVRVKDDGIGVAPELLSCIFEPFVQGARSSDRAEGGLGIGLMLVRSLVELHGGQVSAHSDGPGTGTELVVRLPARTRARTITPPRPEATQPLRRMIGRRILVVDDNDDAADTLADVLRDAGHEVQTAHDGPEALLRARDFRPDVAVLDIGLPVMDGYELAERLRAEHGDGLWMVAVSGYGRDHDRARSHQAGIGMHLVKPVDLDSLLAAVEPRAKDSAASR